MFTENPLSIAHTQIQCLAMEFRNVFQDAGLDQDDNQLAIDDKKLKLDTRGLKIEAAAKELLQIIRWAKEQKLAGPSYNEDRQKHDQKCAEKAGEIQDQISKTLDQISQIADEGFDVYQEAACLAREP